MSSSLMRESMFAGLEVRFTVDGEVLTVCEILEATV